MGNTLTNPVMFFVYFLGLVSINTFVYFKFYVKEILDDTGQFAIYMLLNFLCLLLAMLISGTH